MLKIRFISIIVSHVDRQRWYIFVNIPYITVRRSSVDVGQNSLLNNASVKSIVLYSFQIILNLSVHYTQKQHVSQNLLCYEIIRLDNHGGPMLRHKRLDRNDTTAS